MQDILINWAPQETRVAIVENGAVQELHVERAAERGLVGNIYAGRVARVLPGMQSAFIDIGLERAAFLHVADVQVNGVVPRSAAGAARGDPANGGAPQIPIERLVFEGQTLTVQVIKDPMHQGRAALDADQHRRPAARVFAAGRPPGHLAKNRLARVARSTARAHVEAARRGR